MRFVTIQIGRQYSGRALFSVPWVGWRRSTPALYVSQEVLGVPGSSTGESVEKAVSILVRTLFRIVSYFFSKERKTLEVPLFNSVRFYVEWGAVIQE